MRFLAPFTTSESKNGKKELAILGLEPRTFALLARRSNQLSYTAVVASHAKIYRNCSGRQTLELYTEQLT